ncbi:hypothetical protein BY996DRAFT_4578395 [Phakopsora pachyrhizi]|uniref:DUF1749-domain-containing protein n=1 Tax=Phakopsora pachyrhizi TaxID=170000 RepID=A0AAV0AYD9_PHAPC|nr:hypothetical protein BY996DRAFT_4578395 [Phakopsora pachyrhizi]CAH7674553.1 hypothetical protein PPACK8108_LOCUS9449 [Phakopsora pachyrhizi]
MSKKVQVDEFNQPKVGLIHLYDVEKRLTAFESGDFESPCTLIFIGGLGDGLYSVPYLETLTESLSTVNYSLTQVLLTSSYKGFGSVGLEDDVKEIGCLLEYFKRLGKRRFILFGHSTGCQDIVRFFNPLSGNEKPEDGDQTFEGIVGIILQAPVSDREFIIDTLGEQRYRTSLALAKDLVDSGQGQTPIPNEYSDMFSGGKTQFISASRWLTLSSSIKDSKDSEDFFSSDASLNDDQSMIKNLSNVSKIHKVYSMVLLSGKDETMPSSIDKVFHLNRLVNALTFGSDDGYHLTDICKRFSTILENAGHQVEESKDELCDKVVEFIRSVSELIDDT